MADRRRRCTKPAKKTRRKRTDLFTQLADAHQRAMHERGRRGTAGRLATLRALYGQVSIETLVGSAMTPGTDPTNTHPADHNEWAVA